MGYLIPCLKPACWYSGATRIGRAVGIIALSAAILNPQVRTRDGPDVFSSNSNGGRCLERGTCFCPQNKALKLKAEDWRHNGREAWLKRQIENNKRVLALPNRTRSSQETALHLISNFNIRLAEEKVYHECKVARIQAGCQNEWQSDCMPPSKDSPNDADANPSPTPPPGNGTFEDGFQSGLTDCARNLGLAVDTLLQAYNAARRGDMAGAASLLGATDSEAGLRLTVDGLAAFYDLVVQVAAGDVTSYQAGRLLSGKVCEWALIPAAGKCLAAAGKCVVKAANRGCAVSIARLQKQWPKKTLSPPPSPLFRGMLLTDENLFKRFAAVTGKVFVIRDSHMQALRWIGRLGYKPKPVDIKAKTLKEADLLIPGTHGPAMPLDGNKYLGLASAKGLSIAERDELLAKGYKITSPGDHELIVGADGSKFYSDIDLHGVYNADGSNGWTAALEEALRCDLFDRGVQHGPHDLFALRLDKKAGPNYGPQVGNGKTVTAVFPDGTVLRATTLAEFKLLYKMIGADFEKIYPGF